MTALALQRCLHHADREAAARCPECGQYFCRECITEYQEKVVCSACVQRLAAPAAPRRRNFAAGLRVAAAVVGVALGWSFFYFVGRVLVAAPSSFHEGTIWQKELDRAEEDAE